MSAITNAPLYPEIEIQMVGEDGNALSIVGRCTKAIRRAGLGASVREAFTEEALSGDYDQVLATVMKYFSTN